MTQAPPSARQAVLVELGEVFREHGYEGASLALITARTSLGKGSLYHLFPGGKAQMAAEVLAEIEAWFDRHMFTPLREAADPAAAIAGMFAATRDYFRSGGRVCLVGVLALGDTRDRFAATIHRYFALWRDALADALRRAGHPNPAPTAEDIVAGIQGALTAARAFNDTALFTRLLARMEAGLAISPSLSQPSAPTRSR